MPETSLYTDAQVESQKDLTFLYSCDGKVGLIMKIGRTGTVRYVASGKQLRFYKNLL